MEKIQPIETLNVEEEMLETTHICKASFLTKEVKKELDNCWNAFWGARENMDLEKVFYQIGRMETLVRFLPVPDCDDYETRIRNARGLTKRLFQDRNIDWNHISG